MSSQLGKVLSYIILERFGVLIEKVATYLFKYGANPILYIKKSTDLPFPKVKEALCVLIKFGLVDFKPNKNPNLANYSINKENVLLMLRYPKYINLVKNKFGEEAEIILEEILQSGYANASEIILKTALRLEKDHGKVVPLPELRDKYQSLVIAKYLIRILKPEENPVPNFNEEGQDVHAFPPLDMRILSEKQKGEDVVMDDAEIYWRINHDRFHQDIRDKIVVNAATKKFDENVGEFMRLLLQQMYIRTEPWADTSNPIPILEVKDLVKKMNMFPQLIAFFDQYVSVVEQDSSGMIQKVGEASGGSYQICLKSIFTQLTWEIIEQIVLEKFDSKAARIFRLVKSKQYIEPEQIQKLAMIPAKEAKSLTYQLLEENFLEIQELRKAVTNSGPTKSFILFHVQIKQVVRMALELCYKSLFNILIRRNHEKLIYKRIIDKKQRVDTIALGMKTQGATEEQLVDIEEMITPPEKEILDRIDKTMKKLNLVEIEIDDTIFLLKLFLQYE